MQSKKKKEKKKEEKKKKTSEWGEKRFVSGEGLRIPLGVLITIKNYSGGGRTFWIVLRFISRLGIRTRSLTFT